MQASPAEELRPLSNFQVSIVVFRRDSAIKAMVEPMQKYLLNPVAISYTLVFISQLRLSISSQVAYTESEVYLIRNDCVEKVGVYSNEKHEIKDILNLIGAQVDQSCSK
jgi:hypothetical protein